MPLIGVQVRFLSHILRWRRNRHPASVPISAGVPFRTEAFQFKNFYFLSIEIKKIHSIVK